MSIPAVLAEVCRGRQASEFDNDPYWEAEKEAREAGREFGVWGIDV